MTSASSTDDTSQDHHCSRCQTTTALESADRSKRYNSQLGALKRELRTCKNRFADQNKQLLEYSVRMEEYDKKFDESSRKFSIVLQELNKCKTELQYWRSKSPVHSLTCCSCSGRFLGENSGNGDPFSRSSGDGNDHWNAHSGESSFHRSRSNPYSLFQPSGVKNLESLFDVESDTTSHSKMESNFSIKGAGMEFVGKSSVSLCKGFVPSMAHKGNDLCSKIDKKDGNSTEKSMKRFSSDDDDSDLDINTVGKRVKERKRTKLSTS